MSDSRLQEIVTKAVVGRVERRMTWSHTVPTEGVTGVLGVHIADQTVAVQEHEGRIVADVLVDCDVWCGNQKHTKVVRCTARHTQAIEVRTHGHVLGETEVAAKVIGSARATGVECEEGAIVLHLMADVLVEKSALARMWVKAYDLDDDVLETAGESESESSSSSSDSSSSTSE